MSQIDKIICFDFDGTLFHTPDQHFGQKVFKEKMDLEWPYKGWWSKPESIDMDIFHIPINDWVYQKYLEAVDDSSSHVILATGRLENPIGMRKNIERILRFHNLFFDVYDPLNVIEIGNPRREVVRNGVYLNTGGDTFMFKTRLFEDIMRKMKVNSLLIYDDRHEHLVKFYEWAQKQVGSKITICDVTIKKFKTIEN